MGNHAITITVDTDSLQNYTDQHLATLWHVAQANPAPSEDIEAGRIAEHIGREIIRRFLTSTAPALWDRQGNHAYFSAMMGKFKVVDGKWVEKTQADKAVIVYGPQGCGKTLNGDRLAAYYGKSMVMDHEDARDPNFYPAEALVFTQEPVEGAIPFEQAMAAAGLTGKSITDDDEQRHCKDCQHVRHPQSRFPNCAALGNSSCDLVSGEHTTLCRDMRAGGNVPCGPDGKLFVPRDVETKAARLTDEQNAAQLQRAMRFYGVPEGVITVCASSRIPSTTASGSALSSDQTEG